MDLELAKFLFQVLTFLVAGGTGFYVFMSNKNKVTNDRIEKLEDDIRDDIGKQGERIAKLESGTAKHGDLSDIHNKINGVAKDVSSMTGALSGISDSLKLIMNKIIDKGMQ
ncbi:MAG: hypothetical protein PHD37_17775 [Gallionellaceae bacterium]|nr:hypothetical protein [Gallionellaceae bacterium]